MTRVQEDEEMDELRRRKMMEMQARVQEQQRQAEARRQFEAQKREAIKMILTPEARSRLANIRAAKPEFAEAIELQLIQLAQSGRIKNKITDAQLKQILDMIVSKKRETKIRRL